MAIGAASIELNEMETEQEAPPKENWASFVNRVYGALANDPIERPQQWPLAERDPIDGRNTSSNQHLHSFY